MKIDIIGIIPARAGSKGIKNKNIIPTAGKPLIEWSIVEALKSKYLKNVIVSTNNSHIADISKKANADVVMRPESLSLDHIGNEPVVIHCLKHLRKSAYFPQYIIYLPPTSPLRTVEDIDGAIEFMADRPDLDSLISVCPCDEHPYWVKVLDRECGLDDFIPMRKKDKQHYYRRQNLPKAYSLNGAIYLSKSKEICMSESFYSGCVGGYVMPRERSIDINTQFDLKLAEFLLKERVDEN